MNEKTIASVMECILSTRKKKKKLIWVPASFVCYALICSLIYVKTFLSRAHNLHLALLPKKCTKTEELVLKICLKDMD